MGCELEIHFDLRANTRASSLGLAKYPALLLATFFDGCEHRWATPSPMVSMEGGGGKSKNWFLPNVFEEFRDISAMFKT